MDAILAPHGIANQDQAAKDLVAEANHRIANSLTLLVSMVRMQAVSVKKGAETLTNAEVRQLLDGVAARINTISQLHRILSRSGSEGAVSLKPHLAEVTDALVAALSSPEQSVRVVHTGGDCLVLMRAATPSSISRTSAVPSGSCRLAVESACMRTMLTSKVRLLAMR